MNRRYKNPVTSVALVFVAIVLVLSAGGPRVSAQENEEPAPIFNLTPVDANDGYFDLTLSPGETREIQVEVRNIGTADGEALIYVADVSTRVNGGLAASLAKEPISGPALWIGFTEETVQLEAETSLTRTFTIRVPNDAAPGEHLTSFVIQDAGDIAATQSESGVMLTTVSRQALPVLITVPGPVTPRLQIDTAEHTTVGDRSVVAFHAKNSGNVRIKSTGEVTITDGTGRELVRSSVQYESIYAGTSATLEVAFNSLLEPGDYTASLWLEDRIHGVRFESGPLALHVSIPESPSAAIPQVPQSDIDPAATRLVESRVVGIPTWALLVVILAAMVLGVLIALAVVFGLRRRTKPATESRQPVAMREDSPVAHSQPAAVRQMIPPSRNVHHDE